LLRWFAPALTASVCVFREGNVVDSQDQYRQNARECLQVASEMTDPAAKARLIAMAESWAKLADQVARNDAVYKSKT